MFSSGSTYVRNDVTEIDIAHDQLLADLGVARVAAVPLQVEGRTIGVLLVADKADRFHRGRHRRPRTAVHSGRPGAQPPDPV